MIAQGLLGYAAIAGGGVLSALFAVFFLNRDSAARNAATTPQGTHDVRFAFFRGQLVDSSDEGRQLLDGVDHDPMLTDWDRFCLVFVPRFPDLATVKPNDGNAEKLILTADDTEDFSKLVIKFGDDTLQVSLVEMTPCAIARHQLFLTRRDRDLHRTALDAAPFPIWQSDHRGRLDWINTAYRDLARTVHPAGTDDVPSDSVETLFNLEISKEDQQQDRRVQVANAKTDTKLWFDVRSEQVGDRWLHFAQDMNVAVNAEVAQRNFVQTLTKTFAQLSIGLAIFDRNRQLALFNPALIDLTSLPADFLSVRPDLHSFFDRLRDRRMMPEPKNYASWRDQLTHLITEASHGQYTETWTLPSGLTYRISGRPHPDGAIAFLFEDISAEVSLTRRFRSELELGQSVLDAMEEGVAVFSQLGEMVYSNKAYENMWSDASPSSFVEATIMTSTRHWAEMCDPNPVWADLRDYVTEFGERAEWDACVRRKDGCPLMCRFVPLVGGNTLVGFTYGTAIKVPPKKPGQQREIEPV